jgi:recombination protein RecA
MSEEDRQRTIRLKLARMQSRAPGAIATGFTSLDQALGVGGLPRGSIVELFGPSSAGKTTLALQIVAHAQQAGSASAWIDADHTFDPAYAAQLSVNLEALPVGQPESAEEALEVTRQLALSGAVDLVVVDSAAALVPRIELETSLGEGSSGMQSRVLASGLRKLAAAARTGVVILFLNQTRGGGENVVSAGGPGLKLYAAVRVHLEPTGRGIRFRTVKNKVAAPFVSGELHWGSAVGFVKPA